MSLRKDTQCPSRTAIMSWPFVKNWPTPWTFIPMQQATTVRTRVFAIIMRAIARIKINLCSYRKDYQIFSRLQLGDDRIGFSESILSATYRIPVEEKMAIESPSKSKTVHSRKRDYKDALDAVGAVELDRLERVMKDKLFQRSYMTSSPFQVRKAFKFFDREKTLAISIEGFVRALEFLGFQFNDLQNVALFARYDKDCTGVIDYMNFISSAMFYSPFGSDAENAPPPKPKKIAKKPRPGRGKSRVIPRARHRRIRIAGHAKC